jgi:hypothetical protein
MIVHLHVGALWKLVALWTPLQEYLVYSTKGIELYYGYALYYSPSVEDRWLIATRDRAPSRDGGSMWFMLGIRFVALCETGRGQLGGCGEYWMGSLRVV